MKPVGAEAQESHRAFLNRYYRQVRYVYDPSRKYFLFGRDRALDTLLAKPWQSLLEIGPGTGRNLTALHSRRPGASYGGVEASDAMLELAKRRCPFASLDQGFAESFDLAHVLGGSPPDRILFSYSLSMIQDQHRALTKAREALAPGGEILVVDFGDMNSLPAVRPAFRRFLRSFHVTPPEQHLLESHGAELLWGPGRYYFIARISA